MSNLIIVGEFGNEHAVKYHGSHGKHVEKAPWHGYTDIQVLPELTGLPWCDITLGFVLAVHPTSIRVTTGECTTDAVHGRVTVFIDEKTRLITQIEQEVSVAAFDKPVNGSDMNARLHKLKQKYEKNTV